MCLYSIKYSWLYHCLIDLMYDYCTNQKILNVATNGASCDYIALTRQSTTLVSTASCCSCLSCSFSWVLLIHEFLKEVTPFVQDLIIYYSILIPDQLCLVDIFRVLVPLFCNSHQPCLSFSRIHIFIQLENHAKRNGQYPEKEIVYRTGNRPFFSSDCFLGMLLLLFLCKLICLSVRLI